MLRDSPWCSTRSRTTRVDGGPLVKPLAVAVRGNTGGCGGHPARGPAAGQSHRSPPFGILFAGASPVQRVRHPGDTACCTGPCRWGGCRWYSRKPRPLFLVLVAILLWVFPDGKLPGGRWRRPSVVLLVVGLLLGGAASMSGLVVVARHDVRITATGDLADPPGGVFVDPLRRGHRAVPGRLAGLDRHPDPDLPARRRRAPPAAQVAVQRGGRHAGRVHLRRVRDPARHGPSRPGPATSPVVEALVVLAFGALPVCMGVAVLKYRLYELDRIISRVVSYALITGAAGRRVHRAGAADHACAAVHVGGAPWRPAR